MIFLKLVILFYSFFLPKLINIVQFLPQANENMGPILHTLPLGFSSPLFQREQVLYSQRRKNILDNDKEEESNRRPWKNNARNERKREKQKQQQCKEERTFASKRQCMDDKLWARVEKQEQRADGKINGNALDA